ncbi:MAG: hypothetical protein ACFFCQ_13075 [Promethearchaeota archaeon]
MHPQKILRILQELDDAGREIQPEDVELVSALTIFFRKTLMTPKVLLKHQIDIKKLEEDVTDLEHAISAEFTFRTFVGEQEREGIDFNHYKPEILSLLRVYQRLYSY